MKITPLLQNNTNFEQLHVPKVINSRVERELWNNPAIKQCAEKYDVYVEQLNCGDYVLRGVKKCKNKDIVTPEYRFFFDDNIRKINPISCIETQLREIMMLVVANNYPKDGVFKAGDILNILKAKEIQDNFTIDEAFDCIIEQNGNATLLTKFFEINPADDNKEDYDKVISILKSNPNINYNQKGVLDISILENILNFENSQGLDLLMDTEFEYTNSLDRLFHNISSEDVKKKALDLKIKFPDRAQIYKQGYSEGTFAFLDSPFCKSPKNTAVSLWLDISGSYHSNKNDEKIAHQCLYKYLPEYYRNHYQRIELENSFCRGHLEANYNNFTAPAELYLVDGNISSRELLKNYNIRRCTNEYSVVVERGAQNGVRKKKVPRFLPFLPPKTVEEPIYEYILKGVKKGRDNIETQEHLILYSKRIENYIEDLVNEIKAKDQERFIEIISKKNVGTIGAKEILELLDSDEIKGNYTTKEALTNRINSKYNTTLLSIFFKLKESEENVADYDKLISIISNTPDLYFKKEGYFTFKLLEQIMTLENPKALGLLMDTEFAYSEKIDKLFNSIKDENFRKLARNLKIELPDAVSILKNKRYNRSEFQKVLSYLDSPFCDSRAESIRIWTELKTKFSLNESVEINEMLYKYLPDNLKMDL